jgi:surfactin synthase thioesterase subunit
MTISDIRSGGPTGEVTSRWLPYRAQAGVDRATLALYCLPHAGGAASAYRPWLGKLPGVAVLPVQPPGRENRWREPPHERMGPLVSEMADVVLADVASTPASGSAGRPYAVYGHSLGALVAFELLREIRRRGQPGPVHLFVSGCVAPHTPFDDGPPVRDMSRPELVQTLRRLGGTPEWLLSDPSVLDMIVPAIRADFSVKETTEYRQEPPLDAPITAMPSTGDPRASQELVARWRDQTTMRFELHTFVGGHFAVFEQAARTHTYVFEALRRWL